MFHRARRVDAPPRPSHAFAPPHFQQQQPYITQQNNYETSYNNNFQGTASRSGEPIGGEITPNCVCRCTCCPCCPCNPGEEDYLQYIDWEYIFTIFLCQAMVNNTANSYPLCTLQPCLLLATILKKCIFFSFIHLHLNFGLFLVSPVERTLQS